MDATPPNGITVVVSGIGRNIFSTIIIIVPVPGTGSSTVMRMYNTVPQKG